MKIRTSSPSQRRGRHRGVMGILSAFAVAGALGWFAARPAGAHDHWDWIRQGDFRDVAGQPCCDPKDCKMIPVSSGDVIELEGGDFKYMPTGEIIPRRETRQSPDQNYWRCHWYENGEEVTRKLCFWRPARDS